MQIFFDFNLPGYGTDNGSIVSRLIKELNPLVWPLEAGYLEDIKSLSIPALVIHVEGNDHLTRQLIHTIAPDFRGSVVMGIISHSIPDEPSERDLPFVDVYHPMDEVTRTFDNPVEQKTLVDFAQTVGQPVVGRFDPTTSEAYEEVIIEDFPFTLDLSHMKVCLHDWCEVQSSSRIYLRRHRAGAQGSRRARPICRDEEP